MNEVSIIINGVRYDAEKSDLLIARCSRCEMKGICFDMGNFCDIFGYHLIFKKKEEDNIYNK